MGSAVIFSGNDVKSLKSNLDLNGGAKILSSATDPTTSAVSAPVGSILLNTTSGQVYRKLDVGSSTNWELVGTGSEALNYATGNNSTADTALGAGWTTYDDASATPVDGQGGTVSLTFARSTSSPLHGSGSMLWTPVAAAAGEGAAFTWTQNRRDLAAMMEVAFAYEIGTPSSFTEGDITVWLVSASDSGFTTNLEVVQAVPYKLPKSSGQETFKAVFQSHVSNLYYKVLIHQATTATGYTVKIDDFYVGPVKSAPLGVPSTDWQSYTLQITGSTSNPTKGTISVDSAFWRRVGDSMEITYSYRQTAAGSAGSGAYYFSLPSGYTADSSKISLGSTGVLGVVGAAHAVEGANEYTGTMNMNAAGTGMYLVVGNATTAHNSAQSTFLALSNASVYYSFRVTIPILGWSSNVQMSDSSDTRVVACSSKGTVSGTPTGSFALISYPAASFDTHNAFSSGTYTVPVAGKYQVSAAISISATRTSGQECDLQIKKGGTVLGIDRRFCTAAETTTPVSLKVSVIVDAVVGDTFTAEAFTEGTSPAYSTGNFNHFEVMRLSGPSAIAASETVFVEAYRTSNQSITGSANVDLVFDTITNESHTGSFATGTGIFTAPVAGRYSVSASVQWVSGSFTAGNLQNMKCIGNSQTKTFFNDTVVTTGTRTNVMSGTTVFRLLAGQTIKIQVLHQEGTARSISGGLDANFINIVKVGNY